MINTIILGHALYVLPKLPSESVNCVVTSPPFWSLRDYGVDPVIWDGDKDCNHEFNEYNSKLLHENRQNLDGGTLGNPKYRKNLHGFGKAKAGFCVKCGAWSGSLGLEPTFELYIKHLCDIFDEVERVLRKDGTCFVNMGDSYGGSGKAGSNPEYQNRHTEFGKPSTHSERFGMPTINIGVPDKSLCLIPQHFVIEMVNRGWILRNTIIWHKPNCMPSSAKDRFTVDFEYVYFFVKSKKYWFEQQFEEYAPDTLPRMDRGVNINKWTLGANGQTPHNLSQPRLNKKRGYKTKQTEKEIHRPQHHGKDINYGRQGRNKRTVWSIPTKSFPEAHFAVYPETLIEPMIKAGCPEFICKKCGKAREKIYEGKADDAFNIRVRDVKENRIKHTDRIATDKEIKNYKEKYYGGEGIKFIGYTDCGCNAGFEGGIVLDQFMGAGTTALVALKQRKRFIGIEIKQEYINMTKRRIAKVQQRIF